jgi:DUF1365 family protein
MVLEPGIYVGDLRHRRFRPVRHEFTYPVFQVLLDVDRIPELMRVSRVCSYNRWNWAAYNERDHFGDPALPLRERLRTGAEASGVTLPDGPAFLLTNLRYLGYCFNPVSFYYFCTPAGEVEMMLAEVNNTFGETCNYWLTPECERNSRKAGELPHGARRYVTRKVFHVSPFLDLGLEYRWIFTRPEERLVAHTAARPRGIAVRCDPYTGPEAVDGSRAAPHTGAISFRDDEGHRGDLLAGAAAALEGCSVFSASRFGQRGFAPEDDLEICLAAGHFPRGACAAGTRRWPGISPGRLWKVFAQAG